MPPTALTTSRRMIRDLEAALAASLGQAAMGRDGMEGPE
jgi:hypothetical protein